MTHRLLFRTCSCSAAVLSTRMLSVIPTSPHAAFRERKKGSCSGEGQGKCDTVIQSFFKMNVIVILRHKTAFLSQIPELHTDEQ